jgi:hypothetical protein
VFPRYASSIPASASISVAMRGFCATRILCRYPRRRNMENPLQKVASHQPREEMHMGVHDAKAYVGSLCEIGLERPHRQHPRDAG